MEPCIVAGLYVELTPGRVVGRGMSILCPAVGTGKELLEPVVGVLASYLGEASREAVLELVIEGKFLPRSDHGKDSLGHDLGVGSAIPPKVRQDLLLLGEGRGVGSSVVPTQGNAEDAAGLGNMPIIEHTHL